MTAGISKEPSLALTSEGQTMGSPRFEYWSKTWTYIRKNGPGIAVELLVNFLLPYGIYVLTQKRIGDVNALIASSAPPVAWSLFEFVRRRRLDAVSLLALFGIVLSLLAFIGGGSARVLLLREKVVTVIIAFAFLLSAAIGKPLIYELARAGMARRSSPELESFQALRDNKHFRRSMTLMTLVWGFGLLADAIASAVLVYVMPIRTYLAVGPALGYGTMGALALWTFWYVKRRRRKRLTLEAAAENPRQICPPADRAATPAE